MLRSFVASCQRVGVDPFAWFKEVLCRIASHPIIRLAQLLPHNWVFAQLNLVGDYLHTPAGELRLQEPKLGRCYVREVLRAEALDERGGGHGGDSIVRGPRAPRSAKWM